MEDNIMLCPRCKSKLIVTDQAKLETLYEHVTCSSVRMKDKYECSNPDCLTKTLWIAWNRMGERYDMSPFYTHKRHNYEHIFIDGNDAPFNSFQRQMNVEISKNDENKKLYLGKYIIEVKYLYKSNENGDVLQRKRKYKLFKKCNDGGYLLCNGLSMFLYSLRSYKNLLSSNDKTELKRKIVFDKNLISCGRAQWWKKAALRWFRFIHKSALRRAGVL